MSVYLALARDQWDGGAPFSLSLCKAWPTEHEAERCLARYLCRPGYELPVDDMKNDTEFGILELSMGEAARVVRWHGGEGVNGELAMLLAGHLRNAIGEEPLPLTAELVSDHNGEVAPC